MPHIDLQEVFERRCLDISAIQTQQTTATAKAEATFDALLARFFSTIPMNQGIEM